MLGSQLETRRSPRARTYPMNDTARARGARQGPHGEILVLCETTANLDLRTVAQRCPSGLFACLRAIGLFPATLRASPYTRASSVSQADRGKVRSVLEILHEIRTPGTATPIPLLIAADCMFLLGMLREAISTYGDVLASYSDYVVGAMVAYERLVNATRMCVDVAIREHGLNLATELYPMPMKSFGEHVRRGRLYASKARTRSSTILLADDEYRRAIDMGTNRTSLVYSLLVDLYADNDRLDDAMNVCVEWQDHIPTDANPHRRRGHMLAQTGFPRLAFNAFFEAIALEPRDEETLYRIGMLYENGGRLKLALDAYRRLLEEKLEWPPLFDAIERVACRIEPQQTATDAPCGICASGAQASHQCPACKQRLCFACASKVITCSYCRQGCGVVRYKAPPVQVRCRRSPRIAAMSS